ncbi:MAG: DUF4178 domain-containing protein [Chryseotalea sp.]
MVSNSFTDDVAVCPECKHVNALHLKSLSYTLTCTKCSTYFSTDPDNEINVKFNLPFAPALPIGKSGTFKGETFTVINCSVKSHKKYYFDWHEYQLISPSKRVLYLSEYSGNWNCFERIQEEEALKKVKLNFEYKGNKYHLYQRYSANMLYGRGEYFTDMFTESPDTQVEEFISPPYIMIREEYRKNTYWYFGAYLDRNELITAFNLTPNQLPKKEGRGYTQPFISSFKKDTLIGVTLTLVALLITFQIFFASTAKKEIVFTKRFNGNELANGQSYFITEPFDLKNGTKSLVLEVNAPVANDWFFGDFVLVNEQTRAEMEFSKEVSYYYGVDGGESWSEGSTSGKAFLSKIPEGKYHLVIYPEFSFSNKEFTIRVIRDDWNMSNFWSALILILIFPTYYFIRSHYIEEQRWADSDYSPY